MALTVTEQVQQLFSKSKHILITLPKEAKGDAIASALALRLFLRKFDKHVDIICDDFVLPKAFAFLPGSETIQTTFPQLRKFIISLDLKDQGLQSLTYDMQDQLLRVFVTPKHGAINKEQLQTDQSSYLYDLIITLGAPDLESLGKLYDEQPDLFYQIPIINIDHKSMNERFGDINVVNMTRSAISEVLYTLLKAMSEDTFDEEIATALLTGLIAKTRSFKEQHTKPHTLKTAGELMDHGGNRERIITALYYNRSVPALRLWGKALTEMQYRHDLGMMVVSITKEDFIKSGADPHDIEDIIDELLIQSPQANIILLVYEIPQSKAEHAIRAIIKTNHGQHAKQLLAPFSPKGNHDLAAATLKAPSLKTAEAAIVTHIETIINK